MAFWTWLTGPKEIQGKCVPRAFFNACAWGINNKCKVYIADFKGHWQAVGMHEGELHFLKGNNWWVRPGKMEGNKAMVKLWGLKDAMDHFEKHNPWTVSTEEELKKLNERIENGMQL